MRITIDLSSAAIVRTGFAFGALCLGTLGFFVGRASAAGIPANQPLFYSATLEEAGQPVNDPRNIGIALWDLEVGGDAIANRKCERVSTSTPVVAGRFRVELPPSCLDAIRENPDLFVEVSVNGAPLPREKIGAAPYAVEAERSSSSDIAEAVVTGGVDAQALGANAVESAALADDAVDSRAIADGSIASDDFAVGAVGAALDVKESLTCNANGTERVCTCPANRTVVGGGAIAGVGHAIRESRGISDANGSIVAWALECIDSNNVLVACANNFAYCARAAP